MSDHHATDHTAVTPHPIDRPRRVARDRTSPDAALWGQPETDLDDLAHELSVCGPLEQRSRIVTSARGLDGYVLVRGSECVLTLHPAPTGARRAVVASAHRWQQEHRSHELLRRRRVPTSALPPGVRLRPFLPELHAPDVHRMLYAFWAQTPTHHHRPYDQWRALSVDHPGRDPDHQVVA